jgi:hypothetical protein
MKMKVKPAYLGLLILAIMFGSSIAYPLLQGLFYGGEQAQLPNTNIIDYELTLQQKYLALSRGMVILNYRFNSNCNNCLEQRDYLEQLVSSQKFKEQTFLEEIVVNGTGELPILNMTGFKIEGNQIVLDYRTLQAENVTQNTTFDAVCELMIQPPIDCALKKV